MSRLFDPLAEGQSTAAAMALPSLPSKAVVFLSVVASSLKLLLEKQKSDI